MKEYPLKSCVIQIDDPVEVGRKAGHHWFPQLYPLNRSDILCAATVTDDKAQGKWPGWLYRSRDAGRSWQKASEIESVGFSSITLSKEQVLIMPYELWPLSSGDKRNAIADGTVVTCLPDGRVTTKPAPVRFLNLPRDLQDYNNNELSLLTTDTILELQEGRLFTTLYGQVEPGTVRPPLANCLFAFISEDRGFTWRYLADVANGRDTPGATCGPSESHTIRLVDNRLMCIYRISSQGRTKPYHASYSADNGQTWTKPLRMEGLWSVEPQLVRLNNGILLSGGRPGLLLWVCHDGRGAHWQQLNLAGHHNATAADAGQRFPDSCVAADNNGNPACTTSYTSMKAIGPDEALIAYDRIGNGWLGSPGRWGSHDIIFTVRLRVS
jgi:hypothetical protein